MLAPPVAQGAGGRSVGGTGGGSGGLGNRGQQSVGPTAALWPLTPTQSSASPVGQSQGTPPLSTTPAPAHSQGVSRYGLYSLFPGSNPGGYVAATPATPVPTPTRAYHATTHKVSESVFSAAVGVGVGVGVGGYTWGAPTPPPGSPYSPVPVPVTQLELLAKNLANLAPPAQQALSLQGVGVNVGSLHHAQHTQHTQHTLNLAGLHHLHHAGLHQSTAFSPQLSLVTGSAPTLTINSFSSPNSTSNVVPTTGVLLQEYQSPISSNTNCQTSLSSSSVGANGSNISNGSNGTTTSSSSSSSTSTMLIHGTTTSYQGITKRREAFLPSQGQPIKLENKSMRQPCLCRSTNGKTKMVHSDAGCSRTLPIVSSWNGQDITSNCNGSSTMNSAAVTSLVKREPLTSSVPCQVAEVSTSLHSTTTTAVKIEPVTTKSENGIVLSNSGGAGGIPVGIAVARQRLQHQETSSSTTRNVSLSSHHTSHHASYHHFQPETMGGTAAMTVGGATLLHCGGPGEDRPAHLTIPSTTLPPGLNAALNSTLNSTLGSLGAAATQATAWPHTFWQYPTAAMPMDPVGFPQMGIGGLQGGLQLVRDPSTGHLLLIHAAAEQVQQAVVWPNYPGNSGTNVGPPPLLLPPPPPPSLQLLSDIGGARLVLTENKRKQQNNLPIVKIEADCSNSPTTIISSTESTKALQTVTSMSGALIPDSPLVTTLHYYPHAPALVQISQADPAHCRSQATSPVSCLTPPPESTTHIHHHSIETSEITPIGVQDASNQTDSTEVEEEIQNVDTPIIKQEDNLNPCQLHHSTTTNLTNFQIVSSPEKLCNIVRITNVNSSSSSSSVCNVVAPNKVDKKNDNITHGVMSNNVPECTKYNNNNNNNNNNSNNNNNNNINNINNVKDCRNINSVDRTIEHVVNCHAQEDKMITGADVMRSGPKIIEITEENCDSFHENLEFFTRRKTEDHVVVVGAVKSGDVVMNRHFLDEKKERVSCDSGISVISGISGMSTDVENRFEDIDDIARKGETEEIFESKVINNDFNKMQVLEPFSIHGGSKTTISSNQDCFNCYQNIDNNTMEKNGIEIKKKSFDMPSIDNYEEQQNCEQVIVVKIEKEEKYTTDDCVYSKNDEQSYTENQISQNTIKCLEKINEPAAAAAAAKRNSVEKYHPGIENVVEKLKKNAAAALQDIRKTEKEEEEEGINRIDNVWKIENSGVENGEKFFNNNLISESDESKNGSIKNTEEEKTRNLTTPIKKCQKRPENNSYNSPKKNYVFNNYILNNNVDEKPTNGVHKQDNYNIEIVSNDNSADVVKETDIHFHAVDTEKKPYISKITAVKNAGSKTIKTPSAPSSNDISTTNVNMNAKLNSAKTKPAAVDLSGLELLSNSIEQFEHLKPADGSMGNEIPKEFLKSPVKLKSCITSAPPQNESNNNNVDSPLGLLCALAEQRFMEEVAADDEEEDDNEDEDEEEEDDDDDGEDEEDDDDDDDDDDEDKESKKSLSFDNSEEISQAGILLLNLGKGNANIEVSGNRGDKRKYSEDDYENCKKLRTLDPAVDCTKIGFQCYEKSEKLIEKNDEWIELKENTKRQIDFSDKNLTELNIPRRDSIEKVNVVDGKSDFIKSDEKSDREFTPKKLMKLENGRIHSEYKKKYEYHIRRECKEYFGENYRENELTDSENEQNLIANENYRGSKETYRTSLTLSENGSSINFNSSNEDCRDSHHRYRSQQSEDEAKKFIARKGQADGDTEWPNMDAMELDMRVKLADIQRKYKEKQKELSRLTPKKDDKKGPGRPRKKSHSSSSECGGVFSSPPILEPMIIESPQKSPIHVPEVVPPPLASGVVGMPRCNVNLVKLGEPRSHIKLLDSIPSIPIPVAPVASPITVLPTTSTLLQDDDEKNLTRLEYDTSSPAPIATGLSSASKKRKVGRPRKLMCASGSIRHLTETIVAKKPKSKSSLVGYLLAAKNRHLQNKFTNKTGYTPLPFKSGISGAKVIQSKVQKNSSKHLGGGKGKSKPAKQTPLHNKSVISSIIAEKEKFSSNAKLEKQGSNKVKPKLKAEAKLKTWEDDENAEWSNGIIDDHDIDSDINIKNKETITPAHPESETAKEKETVISQDENLEKDNNEKHEKSKKKKRKSCSTSPKRRRSGDDRESTKDSKRRKSTECKECKECAKNIAKNDNGKADSSKINNDNFLNRCKLTAAHLAIDQLRVLTAMGGLFYAGRLSAVQAPDVYAITLDGERGNRPHIHPREEILRDAIVEVCPSSTSEIPPGTRLCAYWSQQYRCLYPGTSVEPSEPDPELDEKFVSVEFDDGDSGRIALDDIRLLQPDYPVVEYDPNPLLTLGKRRRQTSLSTEEKRSSIGAQSTGVNAANGNLELKLNEGAKDDDGDSKLSEDHKERKRMKKRRKDKLKRLNNEGGNQDGKKRHKKHKCCEEHRKHKHRKHRKHRHRHSRHSSHSEASHHSGGESCSGQKSEEESTTTVAAAPVSLKESEELEIESDDGKCKSEINLGEEKEKVVKSLEEKQEKSKKGGEKKAKSRERQESVESRSKMAAFLPARQLWGWSGKGYRRPGAKGRAKKQFFKAIQRGSETIEIGDSAVFLSTGRPDRPYIGRIKSMWETTSSNMIVKVKWFYHPEETVGCPTNLKYPGALFESPHTDENDVQTISHKCEVLPLEEYVEKLSKEPQRFLTIYDNNDIYYLAGYYDPTTYLLNMQPGVV